MNYNEEMIERIDEVMQEKEFCAALCQAKDKEEIQRIFADKGIELDDVAAQAAFDKMESIRKNDGELSEEDLEVVAGGKLKIWQSIAIAGGCLVGGAVVTLGAPVAVGVGVGCLAMAAGGAALSLVTKGK